MCLYTLHTCAHYWDWKRDLVHTLLVFKVYQQHMENSMYTLNVGNLMLDSQILNIYSERKIQNVLVSVHTYIVV